MVSQPDCLLAQELVDDIIDHLYDCPITLRSCALVCRSWLPSSRLHLFHSIHLRDATTSRIEEQCQHLFQCIEESPEILVYIRELTMDSPTDTSLTLLTNLVHLRSLKLRYIFWDQISRECLESFRDLLHLPNLVHLEIYSLHLRSASNFVALFRSCPSLKVLRLSLVTVRDDRYLEDLMGSSDAGEGSQEAARLEVLELEDTNLQFLVKWLLHPRSPIDISSLRSLRFLDGECLPSIGKITRAAGASLENLEVRSSIVRFPGGITPAIIDIGHNSGISRLCLSHLQSAWMPQTLQLLSQVRSSNKLREVHLNVIRRPWEVCCDWTGWENLDNIFDRAKFDGLSRVTVSFSPPFNSKIAYMEACDGLGQRLPKLVARRIYPLYSPIILAKM